MKISQIIQTITTSRCAFYDTETGEVLCIDHTGKSSWDDVLSTAVMIEAAGDRFLRFPDATMLKESGLVNKFIESVDAPAARNALSSCLQLSEPVNAFRNALSYFNLTDLWSSFRDAALREIAILWCQDAGLELEEE